MTHTTPPRPEPRKRFPSLKTYWTQLETNGDAVYVKVRMPLPRIQSNAHSFAKRNGFTVTTRAEGNGVWVWRIS